VANYFSKEKLSILNNQDFRNNLKKAIGGKVKKDDLVSAIEILSDDIESKTYYPSKPDKVFFAEKTGKVARKLIQFSIRDFYLYYYLVKCLEDEISCNRVEGTYGGWSFGNKITKKEQQEQEGYEDNLDELNTYFSNIAWAKEYGDFNSKLISSLKEEDMLFSWVVEMDIANFYDNINLVILERNIRDIAEKGKSEVCDILFHFLNYWDRETIGYNRKAVGLPQEIIGDASRILANFYLQDYDAFISKKCEAYNAKYFRYCDDQVIIANKKEDNEELVYIASGYLSKLGLNINAKKVNYFECSEFLEQRFDIEFPEIPKKNEDKGVVQEINDSLLKDDIDFLLKQIVSKPSSNIINRARKRLLNLVKKLSDDSVMDYKNNVFDILSNTDFICNCKSKHEILVIQKLCNKLNIDILVIFKKCINESYDEFQITNMMKIIKNKEVEDLCSNRLEYLNKIRAE
jgi:hypothetical protein